MPEKKAGLASKCHAVLGFQQDGRHLDPRDCKDPQDSKNRRIVRTASPKESFIFSPEKRNERERTTMVTWLLSSPATYGAPVMAVRWPSKLPVSHASLI
ncbi:hypothetical protein YC2023_094740 [Brassica napus]